jgi:hypothetical protein
MVINSRSLRALPCERIPGPLAQRLKEAAALPSSAWATALSMTAQSPSPISPVRKQKAGSCPSGREKVSGNECSKPEMRSGEVGPEALHHGHSYPQAVAVVRGQSSLAWSPASSAASSNASTGQ